MPLNGSGVASKPSGTTAVANTTIESAKFNSVVDDLYEIQNTARPITSGGTGAASASAARTALGLGIGSDVQAYNAALTVAGIKGADIASATPDLSAATGNYIDITGTTTITSFGTVAAGQEFTLQFDGALTITHNATSLILPGGESITTIAGSVMSLRSNGSGNWLCTGFQYPFPICFSAHSPASTSATAEVATYGAALINAGSFFNATNGRFTAPTNGNYRVSFSLYTLNGGTSAQAVLYKNGSAQDISAYAPGSTGVRGYGSASVVIPLAKDDYISVYIVDGSTLGSTILCSFAADLINS